MLFNVKKKLTSLVLISSVTLLSACGGSGGNDAPEISGNESVTVLENTLFVEQYTIIDDSDDVSLTLSGTDSALFDISEAGTLEFFTAPDFDNGDIGPFSVSITATDDEGLSNSINVTINVSDVDDTPLQVAIQTVAPDFSTSQVAYANGLTQEVEDGFYAQNQSDYTISAHEENLFHIGRFGIDTITKYNTNEPNSEIYSYSTQENGDSATRNPFTLISVNSTKAYLIRNAADNVLIVNPAATSADDFIIGELDISSYIPDNNSSNTPRPSAGVINNGQLFITMQRLDDFFGSSNIVYLAVFDITTDTEIETNANANDGLLGIPLVGLNPLEHSVRAFEDKVYVTTNNAFGATDLTQSIIEEIDVNDYSLRTVLDSSDITDNTAGFITSTEILSAEQGYFYATITSFSPFTQTTELYQFNPTTGDISTEPVFDFGGASINFIDIDTNGFLWLGLSDNANPGVDIIDTATNTQFGNRLPTLFNATVIRFIEE